MKKLHLHIGSPKTGTTYIQNIFHANRDELKNQEFLYPGSEVNHHKFFFSTGSEEKDWPRQFNGIDRHRLEQNVNTYFSVLERDFRSGYHEQVISTEYLFISDQNYIQNVIEYLEQFFSEIQIYIFVRDPVDYYRSIQQQILKARSYVTSPDQFRIEFKDIIKAWSQYCHVHVIEYITQNDSCEVFCEKIGVDFGSLAQNSQRSNQSLSIEQMALLEKIQRNLYSDKENQFKPHLSIIPNGVSQFTTKPKLKKHVGNIIRSNHREDLQWLKEKYSIDFLGKDTSHVSHHKTDKKKLTVRDVYYVDEQAVELYETFCIDVLLRKIIKK